jgi:hypothetical protein
MEYSGQYFLAAWDFWSGKKEVSNPQRFFGQSDPGWFNFSQD